MSESAPSMLDTIDRPDTEAFVAETPPITTESAKEPAKVDPPKADAGKTDAPKADVGKEKPDAGKDGQVIPLAAHLQERNKLKAEKEAAEGRVRAMEEELRTLKNPPKAAPETPAAVDFTQDPKGYVDQGIKQALDELKGIKTQVEESGKTVEQTRQEAQYNQFISTVQAVESQFVQTTPDYYQALEFARGIRAKQYSLMYPEATPEQIGQAIGREELQLANQSLQGKRNPSEVVYQIAKAMGYAPAVPNGKGGEVEIPPAPPGPKVLDPSQTLGASGEGGGEDLSPDDDGDILSQALKERFPKRKRA